MNGITVDAVASKAKAPSKASKDAISPTEVKTPNAVAKALRDAATSPRIWTAITCMLLAISGGLRVVRDWGFSSKADAAKQSPFPLNDLPTSLGDWRMIKGGELDPEIAQTAGASDHIIRNYVNDKTGETVCALVLYGLAGYQLQHLAEHCYHSSGFTAVAPMKDFERKPAGSGKVVGYRGGVFTKKTGIADEFVEVIYSFETGGDWVGDPSEKTRTFRHYPGMYKIQLARQVNELGIESSPSKSLLEELVKEIDKRLRKSKDPGQSAKTAAAGQSTP
jgi:hypothetical protein